MYKKLKLFVIISISVLFFNVNVNATEITNTCKYTSHSGYNTVYLDIYDDNTAKAYVKYYLKSTEGNGEFLTYDDFGKNAKIQNWNKNDTQYSSEKCPSYALVTPTWINGYNTYFSDSKSDLSTTLGNKKGYVLDNDKSFESYATCEYKVKYTSNSYMKFKIVIRDKDYSRLYYMQNMGDNKYQYVNANFSKLLNSPALYSGSNVSEVTQISSQINSVEDIYTAFEANGNKCPYIISKNVTEPTNFTIAVSAESVHDDVNTFSASAIDGGQYTEQSPEQTTLTKSCRSHFNKNDIPALNGATFFFNQYSDGKKEFCAKITNMSEEQCTNVSKTNNFGLPVTTSSGNSYTFTIDTETFDDFFGDSCIGDKFYIVEEAGITSGSYILTTSEDKAKEGTNYTQGKEGVDLEDKDFNPSQICEDAENCDISLDNFCTTGSVARTFKFLGLLFYIAKILVPGIIIVMGFVNLFKIMTSGKMDDAKKYAKSIIIRIFVGIAIFLIPDIIHTIYNSASNILGNGGSGGFDNCEACLMRPTSKECVIEEN